MKKIYAVLYSEDAFEGISLPFKYKPELERIKKEIPDSIEEISDSIKKIKEIEIEYASQARHGSNGIYDCETFEEFKENYPYLFESVSKKQTNNV